MSDNQKVIYAARTSQEAHLLRNLLVEEGIKAVVVNAMLEHGGIDLVGWATLARVVVTDDDALKARQIAMKFDRKGVEAAAAAQAAEQPPDAEAAPTVINEWPRCPECDAPRSTKCPICGTAGSDFAPVDMGFTWVPDPDDAAAAASCSCGPGGCTPAGSSADGSSADNGVPAPGEDEDPFGKMLMCPTCDEPFTPEYPRLCEWCGHEFEDGFEVELPTGQPEQIDSRVIAVIVGLLALLVALAAYFMFIV